MTELSDDFKRSFNEQSKQDKTTQEVEDQAQKEDKTEKDLSPEEHEGDGELVYGELVTEEEEYSYENFKSRWNKRKITTQIQPYVNHIELFLALISQEYNLEVQTAFAEKQLNPDKSDTRFIVEKSKVNFNWQVLDDRGELINNARISNPFAIATYFGTIQEFYDELRIKNIRGANPCVAINLIEGPKRKNEYVTAARSLWCEDDTIRTKFRTATDLDNPFPLPPSYIAESSRGKFHYYWLTYTEDLKLWVRIQKEVMTAKFGSDPGANGLNRAMRVPGFWHSKKRSFPTRIVFILGQDNIPIEAVPSEEFKEFAKTHEGAYEEYAFEPYLAAQVKRYTWEELVEAFGKYLPQRDLTTEYLTTDFNVNDAIEAVYTAKDYHSSLHSLCMHFANYKQDPQYITHIVQGLMCRTPESHRDSRWTVRFNDIGRSAAAAVTKKLEEQALETLPPAHQANQILKEVGIHDENWHMPFPDITGVEPFDRLMEHFGSGTGFPIKSFNFAAAFSACCLFLQNIPIMPVKSHRTANGCHMLLAPSTEGKDLNTTSPLKSFKQALLHRLGEDQHSLDIRGVINGIQGNTGDITALSAFHKWANQKVSGRGGIWVNTECTGQIGKMADESNLSVANLSEIPINIQDGEPIIPVNKSNAKEGEEIKPYYESMSLLFATQPASIKKYMTPQLLYKGVIGRWDYYVPDRPSMSGNKIVSYISKSVLRPIQWDPELLDFFIWSIRQCCLRAQGCTNGLKRRASIVFEDDDPDPFKVGIDNVLEDGPRRQKFIDWDLAWHADERYQLDPQFNTFADRVQMSVERWITVFTAIDHLWECYQNKVTPFLEPVPIPDKVLDIGLMLGDYQYDVRFTRIWPLIGSGRGLDNQHKAILEAIQKADSHPDRWLRYVSPHLQSIHQHLFKNEFYLPINCLGRFLALDEAIPTRDILPIVSTLQAMGLVEFVANKAMDARISSKPIKNVVRLTAEGRQ